MTRGTAANGQQADGPSDAHPAPASSKEIHPSPFGDMEQDQHDALRRPLLLAAAADTRDGEGGEVIGATASSSFGADYKKTTAEVGEQTKKKADKDGEEGSGAMSEVGNVEQHEVV